MSKQSINSQTLSNKSIFSSVARLKETKVLVFCGAMAAIAIILGQIATIKIGPYLRIGFSGIPNEIVDYLFGPWVGAIFGATLDIVKVIISGDSFFPGFTLTAIVGAIIYGSFLYNKPIKVWRILVSQLLVKVICNIVMNTIWLNMLYGKAIAVILPERIIKNAVLYPVDCIIMFIMLTYVAKLFKPHFNQ